MISKLMEHNKLFDLKMKKADELKVFRPDLASDVEYEEQCMDVHVWVTKVMRDWEHETLSKPRGWENTLEGKTELQLFRETKRIFWNLYETLKLQVASDDEDLQQADAEQVLPHRPLLSAEGVRLRQRQLHGPLHRQRPLAHRSHHGGHP